MGYESSVTGFITVDPPLKAAERDYLERFTAMPHVKRKGAPYRVAACRPMASGIARSRTTSATGGLDDIPGRIARPCAVMSTPEAAPPPAAAPAVTVDVGESGAITLTVAGEDGAVDLTELAATLIAVGLAGVRPISRPTDVEFATLEAPDGTAVRVDGAALRLDAALRAIGDAVVMILGYVLGRHMPPAAVSVTELRTTLGYWLDEAVRGRSLVITRRRRPVAALVPFDPVARVGWSARADA